MSDFELLVLEKGAVECLDVLALLGSYTDQDLTVSLHGRVADHIACCPQCKKLEATYRLTVELARELRNSYPPVPPEVNARLRQALNKKLGLSLPIEG